MQTYIPENIETFQLSAIDFLNAGDGDWRSILLDEKTEECGPFDTEEEKEEARKEEAKNLAGFYWWTCCPGCMPDSEASGPFDTELEAIEDAGGGEYEDKIVSLAKHLECSPSELSEERHNHYGLTVFSLGNQEYAVGTDEEADEAWEQELDNYIEECIQPEIDKLDIGSLSAYVKFDDEMWKHDAKMDGRGHAIARYDGDEIELDGDFYAFRLS